MKIRTPTFIVLVIAGFAALGVAIVSAQAPVARGPGAAPARGPAGSAPQVHGNLLQVMRGILFPNSNVIFAAQSQDPASVKKDADPTSSVNPLAGAYGGWEAIENSGIAMAE